MTEGPATQARVTHASPGGAAPEHWAAALARVRDEVNPAVEALIVDGVSLAAVSAALRRSGPAFEQHCAAMPLAAQDRWASALAGATIRALASRQWSDRTVVPWTVTELLPRLAPHVPDVEGGVLPVAPGRGDLVAELVHAAGEVWRHGDVGMWGRLLLSAAGGSSPHPGGAGTVTEKEIRDIGVVAAWRAGHVRVRTAAHRVGPGMGDDRLARALDLTDGALAREALAANAVEPATWLPQERVAADGPRSVDSHGDTALRAIGGFAGFGGPFHAPPVVVGGDGLNWRLREPRPNDDDAGLPPPEWDLMVDVHGAWLVPAGTDVADPLGDTGSTGDTGDTGDTLSGRTVSGRTVSGRTVLLTSPQSHVVVHARSAA